MINPIDKCCIFVILLQFGDFYRQICTVNWQIFTLKCSFKQENIWVCFINDFGFISLLKLSSYHRSDHLMQESNLSHLICLYHHLTQNNTSTKLGTGACLVIQIFPPNKLFLWIFIRGVVLCYD